MDKNFRDMCAIMAMQGLVVRGENRDVGGLASRAFDIADAMAAEREKRERAATAADYVGGINRGQR